MRLIIRSAKNWKTMSRWNSMAYTVNLRDVTFFEAVRISTLVLC